MGRRPMTPQDSIWLELDRPDNLMAITSVLWTTTPVDPDRLRALLVERVVDRYPVFRQRPVLHRGPVRWGHWADDPDFDLDRHVLVEELAAGADRAALEDYVAAQRSVPLDRAHPLWTVHLLQGYRGGSALVQRYHHAMADGVRLTQVMLGILDPLDPDGAEIALPARVGGRAPVHRGSRRTGPVVGLLHTAGSAVKIGLWSNPGSLLDGRVGVEKTATWSDPVPLAALRGIADRAGASVNDVCTTLICGAVARYLEDAPPERRLVPGDDDLAWMVPVNLDPASPLPPTGLGNHFALVLAVLPHGPAAFTDRLPEVRRRIARIRDSWEPLMNFGLQRGIALSPSLVGTAVSRLLAAKAVGVLTNVPGPPAPMALAGARVAGAVGWAPCSGDQSLTVCVFSFSGEVTVGFGTDRTVLPDPERLVAAFHAELAGAQQQVPAPG
ncbi:wax ester/triacylglycerol synthase domain-containing protein [Blastococcus tunisiensis]|uniref:diacylglycerol O-acyltransferase n=1 Tax=Blastococcus tunisiensis TaxID=1798228 RepID=A0A1I2FL65_9ACTN|nr:wax ester/triacylglycerol synthase domain-containing protein [Blastococcus sp. DSM 46838]SFF05589.1 acyltransferase, WS/DGAT/MGAT [Blastococcus sp. DSM 46838]